MGSLHFRNSDAAEIEKFIQETTIIDDSGNPLVLWHGSRTNSLIEFDKKYEGTGIVSGFKNSKYGGFFFGSERDGVKYYSDGGIPESPIDTSIGEILVDVYGDGPYFFNIEQRNDIAYSEKFNTMAEEYKKQYGENCDLDSMEFDIDDKYETLGNGGPYSTSEEAELAAENHIKEINICYEKKIDPCVYPIHLNIKKLYIHDCQTAGAESPSRLIEKVIGLKEGYTGLCVRDVMDGDTYMDVYVAFSEESIMILDKLNPETCGFKKTISSTLNKTITTGEVTSSNTPGINL